jgi:serine/threonine protein kinase
LIGKKAGRYTLTGLLGEGGMAKVYAAQHESLELKAAVKLLRHSFFHKPHIADRFQAEAQIVSRLSHQNVITVYDYGIFNGIYPYLVMEFLDGETLHDLRARGEPLTPSEVIRIAAQLLDALEAAHKNGVVHRDLKPDNNYLLPRPEGSFVKLLDFGIAKIIQTEEGAKKLTQTGTFLGTPRYTSPEQASGGEIDGRADLYSLGILLYELFCGRPPFEGDTFAELVCAHVSEVPPDPREIRPNLSPAFAAFLLRAIEKQPERRFQNAREMAEAMLSLPKPYFLSQRALASPQAAPSHTELLPVPASLAITPPAPLSLAVTPTADAPHPTTIPSQIVTNPQMQALALQTFEGPLEVALRDAPNTQFEGKSSAPDATQQAVPEEDFLLGETETMPEGRVAVPVIDEGLRAEASPPTAPRGPARPQESPTPFPAGEAEAEQPKAAPVPKKRSLQIATLVLLFVIVGGGLGFGLRHLGSEPPTPPTAPPSVSAASLEPRAEPIPASELPPRSPNDEPGTTQPAASLPTSTCAKPPCTPGAALEPLHPAKEEDALVPFLLDSSPTGAEIVVRIGKERYELGPAPQTFRAKAGAELRITFRKNGKKIEREATATQATAIIADFSAKEKSAPKRPADEKKPSEKSEKTPEPPAKD